MLYGMTTGLVVDEIAGSREPAEWLAQLQGDLENPSWQSDFVSAWWAGKDGLPVALPNEELIQLIRQLLPRLRETFTYHGKQLVLSVYRVDHAAFRAELMLGGWRLAKRPDICRHLLTQLHDAARQSSFRNVRLFSFYDIATSTHTAPFTIRNY